MNALLTLNIVLVIATVMASGRAQSDAMGLQRTKNAVANFLAFVDEAIDKCVWSVKAALAAPADKQAVEMSMLVEQMFSAPGAGFKSHDVAELKERAARLQRELHQTLARIVNKIFG